MSGTFWASRRDRRRLRGARSAVLMVGGYNGWNNYGDVLQLAAAIETVSSLPGSPLPIAIVERATLASHASVLDRFPDQLGGAVYAHFDDGGGVFDDDLVELSPGIGPARAVTYLYGGGYLNHWWGERNVAVTESAGQIAGRGVQPLVATGLQVDGRFVRSNSAAGELIGRGSWIGVRDIGSLDSLRSHPLAAGGDGVVVLSGDDATPLLDHGPVAAEPVVNLHLSGGYWVSDEPEAMVRNLVPLLRRLGEAAAGPLELQPVIAREDARNSEAPLASGFLERHGAALEASGLVPRAPLDVLSDAISNRLERFRRARFTVCCSYHVALSSLLAGIPTLLLAANAYYDQKAAGLRDLFGLDRSLVGVRGVPEDAAAAAEAIVDGSGRAALVNRLRDGGLRVVERQRRGRAGASEALAEGLGPSGGLLRRLRGG